MGYIDEDLRLPARKYIVWIRELRKLETYSWLAGERGLADNTKLNNSFA